MRISKKKLNLFSIAYIYVPVFILIIGWCRLWFSIPILFVLGYAFYRVCSKHDGKEQINFKPAEMFLCFLAIFMIAIYSGWGGIAPQSGDWGKHNAILRDLIQKDWPVIYENHGVSSMLTYYLGQYMVPALGGKVLYKCLELCSFTDVLEPNRSGCSFFAAEMVMFMWNSMGLFLVWGQLFFLLHDPGKKFLVGIIFCFFGNPLVLGKFVYSLAGFDPGYMDYHRLDHEIYLLQYTTNFALLRWVFQHCLVPWMVMGMVLNRSTDIETYIFVGLPVVIYSPFAFLGMLPFMFVNLIRRMIKEKKLIVIKACFSIPNVLTVFSLGSFLFLFFFSYLVAEKPKEQNFSLYLHFNAQDMFFYTIFCLFTFGIYTFYLIKDFRKNPFWWTAVISLLVLPFFRMGEYNDLVMRASIPALFTLCVFCLDILLNKRKLHSRLFLCSFAVFFVIGFYYPVREFYDVVQEDKIFDLQERIDYGSLEQYANPEYRSIYEPDRPVEEALLWNYYTYDTENCVFLKTIGQK